MLGGVDKGGTCLGDRDRLIAHKKKHADLSSRGDRLETRKIRTVASPLARLHCWLLSNIRVDWKHGLDIETSRPSYRLFPNSPGLAL